ncbi:MAG: DUF1295 domain-containing protein [Clostridia bacterium]|nr:DUF1295 domain-containing protein [Clostridia bacterium]
MRKTRDLLIISLIYLLAFAAGFLCCFKIDNAILKFFVFDTVATIVTFIFSVILANSSVYDAYWSLTPMVMSIWLFLETRAFSVWQLLLLTCFNIWGLRLTLNWVTVFTDFTYEDWRYRKYRAETPRILWPIVNFFGIHYMPTIVVFLGMLPLFEVATNGSGPLSLIGDIVILIGVLLEYFADKQMHSFLSSTTSKTVCQQGLWRLSRHPNYLGEITVWLGVFLAMLPYSIDKWMYGIGFVAVAILFNVVSIPLMEKRQLQRRPEYSDYKATTSRLLILPNKK